MGRILNSEFTGSRARFQRLTDQRIYSGWLLSLDNESVLVTSEETVPISATERFLFQVQGPTADAYFIATSGAAPVGATTYVHGATALQVVDLPALDYRFHLITQIQMRESQQQARKAVGALLAILTANGESSEVLIADASAEGMGVIAWQELKRGDAVRVEVQSPEVNASLVCEVRHCRPEQHLIGAYRVGLQFKDADRLSLISWRKLVNPA